MSPPLVPDTKRGVTLKQVTHNKPDAARSIRE